MLFKQKFSLIYISMILAYYDSDYQQKTMESGGKYYFLQTLLILHH